jgi:putative transposase
MAIWNLPPISAALSTRDRPTGTGGSPRSSCSDGLEFTCWNGEVVRVAIALDCHDREVIGWVATTAGISGEMIRDMMVYCVEQRFDAIRAPHPVQWLSDNGSIFAAIEIAVALNLVPCFTPLESPESNGMADAFVKTFKRDYLRVSPILDAAAALALNSWMGDYNTVHPHSRLGHRSPRELHHVTTRRVSGLTGSTPDPYWSAANRV